MAVFYTVMLAVFLLWTGWAFAQPRCSVGLSLGLDRSTSMSPDDIDLIRQGMAEALLHPSVLPSLIADGTVYVQAFAWSVPQKLLHDWIRIESRADVQKVVDAIMLLTPGHDTTYMGSAILFAKAQFDRIECDRYVLDLLTDGDDYGGKHVPLAEAHAALEDGTHTVNALYVGTAAHDLKELQEQVIFGWGSFVEIAPTFKEIDKAMMRKLTQEIS
jgi:hypothetical protein